MSRVVCSTMTTAAAPCGRGAPVATSIQVPETTNEPLVSPVNTRPMCRNATGASADAGAVSDAITAYPSMAARSNAGTS